MAVEPSDVNDNPPAHPSSPVPVPEASPSRGGLAGVPVDLASGSVVAPPEAATSGPLAGIVVPPRTNGTAAKSADEIVVPEPPEPREEEISFVESDPSVPNSASGEEGPTQIRIPAPSPRSSGPLPPLHVIPATLGPGSAHVPSSANVPSGPPSIGSIMRQMGEPSRDVGPPAMRVPLPPLPAPSEPTTEIDGNTGGPLPSLFARPVPAPTGTQPLPPIDAQRASSKPPPPPAPAADLRITSPPIRVAPTLPSNAGLLAAEAIAKVDDAKQSESRLSVVDPLVRISKPGVENIPDSVSPAKPKVAKIPSGPAPTRLDRYEIVGEIAAGGMATVYLGRLAGVGGFQRFVAIKRLHPHLANEPDFVTMFLDEARLAASIHHPHVVPILEVGTSSAGYYVVMEYIEGDTFGRLLARAASMKKRIPRGVVLRVVLDSLLGLHAAHELRDENDAPVNLVHRDVSPQNILVGTDGNARITDFGVARATSRLASTRSGQLKGKLAYMAPEQAKGEGAVDRRADVFAVGIVLWEALLGKRLFKGETELQTLHRLLFDPIPRITDLDPSLPAAIDEVIVHALRRDPNERYESAAEMADALERAAQASNTPIASSRHVTQFVNQTVGVDITSQRDAVRLWLQEGGAREVSAMKPPVPSAPPFSTTPPPSSLDLSEGRRSSAPPEDPTRADSAPPPSLGKDGAAGSGSGVSVPVIAGPVAPTDADAPPKKRPTVLVLGGFALLLAGTVAFAALRRGGVEPSASGTVLPADSAAVAVGQPSATGSTPIAPPTPAPTASAAPPATTTVVAPSTAAAATTTAAAATTTTASKPPAAKAEPTAKPEATAKSEPTAKPEATGKKPPKGKGEGAPPAADPADEYKHLNPYRQ